MSERRWAPSNPSWPSGPWVLDYDRDRDCYLIRDRHRELVAETGWTMVAHAIVNENNEQLAAAAPKRDELSDNPSPKFNYYRASGQAICEICGEQYSHHPLVRMNEKRQYGCELFVLCNTDRVKC